jgi:hypothetical protein
MGTFVLLSTRSGERDIVLCALPELQARSVVVDGVLHRMGLWIEDWMAEPRGSEKDSGNLAILGQPFCSTGPRPEQREI